MTIAFKIKKIRLSKNICQKYMADILDISQSYYNKIENGQAKLTVECLLIIANELKTTPEYFLGSHDNTTNSTNSSKNLNGKNKHLNISYSEEERQLYREQIILLKNEISFLKRIIDMIKST